MTEMLRIPNPPRFLGLQMDFHLTIPYLRIRGIPIEGTPMLIKPTTSTTREEVKTHQEHREGGEAGFNEGNLARPSVISAPPRHNTITYFSPRRGEVFGKYSLRPKISDSTLY